MDCLCWGLCQVLYLFCASYQQLVFVILQSLERIRVLFLRIVLILLERNRFPLLGLKLVRLPVFSWRPTLLGVEFCDGEGLAVAILQVVDSFVVWLR